MRDRTYFRCSTWQINSFGIIMGKKPCIVYKRFDKGRVSSKHRYLQKSVHCKEKYIEMNFNFMNNLNCALISIHNFMIIKMRAVLMIYSGLISKLVQIQLAK